MRLKTFVVSEIETNCYIIIDENTLESIVIDPGDEAEKVINFIESENLKLNSIVLTHAHFDHTGGVKGIQNRFSCPLFMSEGEEPILENSKYNLSVMFGKDCELKADKIFKDGEEYNFGNLTFSVISTPGHTPGGACYYFKNEKVLFSGDTLFYASVGRTDLMLGNTEDLYKSIRTKLFKLNDDVCVYPGHGQKTSIGFEKKYNPYVS